MRRAICDTCRHEGALDNYGTPVAGWITVTERNPDRYLAARDFCSPPCLIAAYAPGAPSEPEPVGVGGIVGLDEGAGGEA